MRKAENPNGFSAFVVIRLQVIGRGRETTGGGATALGV